MAKLEAIQKQFMDTMTIIQLDLLLIINLIIQQHLITQIAQRMITI